MIQKFVAKWESNKGKLREKFSVAVPDSYTDIVREVVKILHDEDEYGPMDPERIHVIDDGAYQGTLLFVIGATGYQPSTYWAVSVSYGSCSGCDTLEDIKSNGDWESESPTDSQVNDLMTLALHIVQGLVLICGSDE